MSLDAWRKAGRDGSPRLVAIAYFALGDAQTGRAKIYDYYSVAGDEIASVVVNGVRVGAPAVREVVQAYEDLGVDDLIFNPSIDDINEVSRLAEIVL